MARHNLSSLFSAIAAAIRAKTGSTAAIVADNFPEAIAAIPTGDQSVLTKPTLERVSDYSMRAAVNTAPLAAYTRYVLEASWRDGTGRYYRLMSSFGTGYGGVLSSVSHSGACVVCAESTTNVYYTPITGGTAADGYITFTTAGYYLANGGLTQISSAVYPAHGF